MKETVSSALCAGARRVRLLVACVVTTILAAPASAGDGNRATSDVADAPFAIPYEGFVMRNNAPYDSLGGTVPLTFRLHPAPECGGCGADCCALWEETQDVVVHAGRFSVALGSTVPLDDVLLDAELTYLSITVDGVQLSGFQAIEPAAYAVWAANAADFTVNGTLATDQISPNAASFVSVSDDLVITGNGASLAIRPASLGGGVRFEMTDANTSRFARLNASGEYAETMLTLSDTGVGVAEALTVGDTLDVSSFAWFHNTLAVDRAYATDQVWTPVLRSNPVDQTIVTYDHLDVGRAAPYQKNLTVTGNVTVDGTLRVGGHNIQSLAYSDEYQVTEAYSGFAVVDMLPVASSVCFLTWNKIVDPYRLDGLAECRILEHDGVWRLQAGNGDTEGDVVCAARCLTWQ